MKALVQEGQGLKSWTEVPDPTIPGDTGDVDSDRQIAGMTAWGEHSRPAGRRIRDVQIGDDTTDMDMAALR